MYVYGLCRPHIKVGKDAEEEDDRSVCICICVIHINSFKGLKGHHAFASFVMSSFIRHSLAA